MRLFLLPINSRNTLIYAQRLNKQLTSKKTRVELISIKASERWTLWESYDKGWQKKVTTWGNQLLARVPYQEWGLKSIPPLSARRSQNEIKGEEKIELLFPGSTLPSTRVPDVLQTLVTERQAFHRQRMIWTLVGMPFTIPFALLPVIPNLPFFYMAFRAWSHWKALAGSRHVTHLIENNLINYSPSSLLQKIYDIKGIPSELIKPIKDSLADTTDVEERTKAFARAIEAEKSAPTDSNASDPDALLISKNTGQLVTLCFGVPNVDVELGRAFAQVQNKISAQQAIPIDQGQSYNETKENKK